MRYRRKLIHPGDGTAQKSGPAILASADGSGSCYSNKLRYSCTPESLLALAGRRFPVATSSERFELHARLLLCPHQLAGINTIIKTTSVCDGDATSVGGGRGWLAGDTDGLAGWPVTVGLVEVGVGAGWAW